MAQQPPIYVEGSCGEYIFPKFLFSFADGLKKSPGSLWGKSCSLKFRHPITRTLSIGFQLSQEKAGSSSAEYLTSDAVNEAAQNGVQLVNVSGASAFTIKSWGAIFEKAFPIKKSRFTPFIQGGLGRGLLINSFRGAADLNTPGYGMVRQPADDRSHYSIWVPTFDSGFRFRLRPQLSWIVAGHWNTGFGLRTGLEVPVHLETAGHAFRGAFKKVF